jgi:hypothetical protein
MSYVITKFSLASLALAAASVPASAALIPGGTFTAADGLFPDKSSINTANDLDAGWLDGYGRWGITGNAAQGPTGSFGAYNVFGQLFIDTLDRTGVQTLTFDLDTEGVTSGSFQYLVVGSNTVGTGGDNAFSLRPNEDNGSSPENPANDVSGVNYTVLGSGTIDLASFVGPLQISDSVDFGTGFDIVGIRLGVEDLGGSDRLAIVDNVAISVPEPGSLALLVAGATCVLARRRSA